MTTHCPHRTVRPHHDGTWTCLDCHVTYWHDRPLCRKCLAALVLDPGDTCQQCAIPTLDLNLNFTGTPA